MADKNEPLSLGELSDEEREALIEAGELEPGESDGDIEVTGDDAEADALKAVADDEAGATTEDADVESDDAEAKAAAEKAAAEEAAAKATEKADADLTDEERAAKEAAEKEAADKAAAEAEAAKQAAASADDDDDDFVPDFRGDPKRMEAIDGRLKEISDEATGLRTQMGDGDLNTQDYLEAKEKLDDERIDLKAEQRELQHGAEMTDRMMQQRWDHQQKRFFEREENAIFRQDNDPMVFEALNAQVKLIATEHPTQSGAAILRDAAGKVRERFNLHADGVKKATDDTDAKDGDAAAKRKAAADRAKAQADKQTNAPKTVADVPAAAEADEDIADDEFAELDRMLGDPDPGVAMEAEMRIARLPADAQRRFGMVGTH